jgi:predicted nucleic acid-binding protein
VIRWLREGRRVACRLGVVEVVAALARRMHRGVVTPAQYRRLAQAVEDESRRFTLVELDPSVEAAARQLLGKYDLRTGDAVQLASCLHVERHLGRRVDLVCYDETLAAAASAEGVRVLGAE